ncbi:VOC family protein [Hyphococcus sp.]|uniref:VOC family protein n=1 Tax=Hyphococcus sp. TaxID=2038636 RepID=UPI0035C662B4
MSVVELGYMGLSVSDADAWKTYAGEIAGMQVVDRGEKDRFYLRMDEWSRRFTLHLDGGDDLKYLGWRVAGPRELDDMARTLEAANHEFEIADNAECEERGVLAMLKLLDPSGNPTEIFHGPEVSVSEPFHPGRPMYGRFLTGDQGIGHLILRQHDNEKAIAFYEMLGLRGGVEYKLTLPNGMLAQPIFMSCNARQHSIAFGLGPMEKRVNHFMFEYTHLDDLGLAHDEIRKRQIDVALQLGKHSNDQALTFYAANPSGWLWEFGWGAREVLRNSEYYREDIFGHGNEATGYGMDVPL